MENAIKGRSLFVDAVSFKDMRLYMLTVIFVAGNIVLPWICHVVPNGGRIFLPIFFFTLIASYKFGIRAGLATAILSPLANFILTGMPAAAMLPSVLIKSILLAAAAAYCAAHFKKVSLLLLAAAVVFYQAAGAVFDFALFHNAAAVFLSVKTALPGLLIQIAAGYLILSGVRGYGDKTDR